MTPRTATLIGLTAILMWSLLAALTVATGKIPAFQLAAMTFAIGALVGFLTWIGRRECDPRVAAAAAGVDRRRRRSVRLSRAVFSGAALRAAGRSRPAELSLAAVDRAVLVAAAGRAAGAASYRRRAARACRHGAAVSPATAAGFRAGQVPGLVAAFVAAFVWAAYSVMSRKLKSVPTDAVAGFCLATALLAAVVHGLVEVTVWPDTIGAMACDRGARRRTGRGGILCLGYRDEARRHPRARRGVLRDAAALDRVSDSGGLCKAERQHRDRGGADRRRRLDRGKGHDEAKLRGR